MNRALGYADFIRLLNINNPCEDGDIPGCAVRFDGVYVIPPDPSESLTPGERAILSEHPTGDLSKLALSFPCSWQELENFIDWAGLRHKHTFPQFFTYRETFIALQSRYPDLTEAEFRMWVNNGKGYLVAFENKPGNTRRSRLRNPAFRFYWDCSYDSNQSINALLDCWFPAKHVLRFIPPRRYLTYEQLAERWQNRTSDDIHKFITDKVNDFRKKENYKGIFEFWAFDPLVRSDLPIEEYVFALDQVEKKEKAWFTNATGTRSITLRPFQGEDARYFSRLPKWTRQQAGYLVQGQVRVSASGHYCYDDSSVVFCYDYFPSYEIQPPEADYADLFSRLSFPMTPLEFIRFCELRGIPLPPDLVAKVKEIEGVSALTEPPVGVSVVGDHPHSILQKSSKKDKDKSKSYKLELLKMEDLALENARRKAPKEASFKQFIEALDGLKDEEYAVIKEVSVKGEVTWKDSDTAEYETISARSMRNRFTRAKERNPYSHK